MYGLLKNISFKAWQILIPNDLHCEHIDETKHQDTSCIRNK